MTKLNKKPTVSDKMFEDIKQSAIKLWQTYDDTYGYASEKIARIEPLTNVYEYFDTMFLQNWQVIMQMFDIKNQVIVSTMVEHDETKAFLEDYITEQVQAWQEQ